MSKRIIGYIFKDVKYRLAAEQLFKINFMVKPFFVDFSFDSVTANNLRDLGILEIWCNAEYDEEEITPIIVIEVFNDGEIISYLKEEGMKRNYDPRLFTKWEIEVKDGSIIKRVRKPLITLN